MQKYREIISYVILLIIGFVLAIMKFSPEITKFIDVKNQIKDKNVQIEDLERKLQAIKTSEMAKINTSGQIKNIYKPDSPGLAAESSFTVLFDDIIDMGRYNGIKLYSIEYVYNPPEDEFVKGAADKYNVCQLNMQIISDYSDLESFLKELFKYPYLININKIEIAPYPKDKKILMTILQIKLYALK